MGVVVLGWTKGTTLGSRREVGVPGPKEGRAVKPWAGVDIMCERLDTVSFSLAEKGRTNLLSIFGAIKAALRHSLASVASTAFSPGCVFFLKNNALICLALSRISRDASTLHKSIIYLNNRAILGGSAT